MRPGNALTLAAFAGSTYVLASFANAQCGAPWSFIPGTGPSARYGHAMVFESATHHTILFGGYGLADTWHYTGATQTWSQLPIAGPSWRYGHALTFDAAQGTILLFGGMHGNTPLAETWSFDPLLATWTMLSPAAAPAPRLYPAMAYDSARARTVLFGGGAPDGPFYNDTWEFDAAAGAWLHRSTPAAPSPRWDAGMAFDTARGRTVLTGGFDRYSVALQDQWEWDGNTWQQISAANIPSPSQGVQGMVFDPARAAIVAFTGDGHAWEYNASAQRWTLRAGEGPGVRGGFGLAFDTDRHVAVLHGGAYISSLSDTWEWSPANAGPAVSQCPVPLYGTLLGRSASLTVAATGSGTLQYQWLQDGQPVFEVGGITGSHTATLHFDPLQAQHAGQYSVTVSDDCGQITTPAAWVLPELRCYANCDQSTTPPYLNVNDFICFQRKFAAGDTYANCDNTCNPVCLTVNDFICFLSRFAAGCP